MDFLLNPITVLGSQTSWLEILAILFTLASVALTNFRKKSLYPVGIIGTTLFFFLFWNYQLYASAGLQVYFTLVQIYGWWFWYKGDKGREPFIGNWGWGTIGLLLIPVSAITLFITYGLDNFTNASTPFWDTHILCLSALAQFLLDRKQKKHWFVWAVVNVIAICVYGSQELWLTAFTYLILLANIPYGWYLWDKNNK